MFCLMQVICDKENEENSTSTDTCRLPVPTESEALVTHNESVCLNNEGTMHAYEN